MIKRNQADIGSKMFSSAGGGGGKITDGSLDEIRHELTETNAKLDALKAALLQRLAEIEQSQQAGKTVDAAAAKAGGTWRLDKVGRVMVEPDSSFHAHTRPTNESRPRSRRERPSLRNWFSTTIWVAIPAWSVPSCHSVLKPRIR